MEKEVKTEKMKRQRKFMLVIPVLVMPFVTIMAWAMGVGKQPDVNQETTEQKGFNFKLPDAREDEKEMNKMAYYNKARQDSAKFQELVKNDPNYRQTVVPVLPDSDQFEPSKTISFTGSSSRAGLNTSVYGGGNHDKNSQEVYAKLAQLNREMNRPPESYQQENYASSSGRTNATVNNPDVERLEQMMNMMSQSDGEDPEMRQLDGMLEKILDIQNPGRVQEKLKEKSEERRGQVYTVSRNLQHDPPSVLSNQTILEGSSGFYSLQSEVPILAQNAIQAVVHENQVIVNGSTVKLRLVNDIVINGVQVPKNSFLFGMASLNGERLGITIQNIVYNNSLYPVELSVYDLDGLDGIYIPGAITRDVAKQSADRSMQNIGISSIDPSWGAQAASAGIEAAKTLFSKKVTLVKVTVKAGYQVLLRDEKQKQNPY